MPTVKGDLVFVSSRAAQVSEVWMRAPKVRTHLEGVVTTGNDHFPVIDGEVSFSAVPGPAVLALISQGRAVDTIPIVVGDGAEQTLRQVVEAAEVADEADKRTLERLAAEVVRDAAAAASSAGAAKTSAGEAASSAGEAASSAGAAKADAGRAATSASNAAGSASAAEASAGAASASESNAAGHASEAARHEVAARGYAKDAENSATRAGEIAESTSWDGDRLTVNGKTSPSLTGPQGDRGKPGESGASTWDAISGKPETYPPESHTHTLEAIKDAESLADKNYVDTALADAKAYTDALIVVGDTDATDGKLHIVYE